MKVVVQSKDYGFWTSKPVTVYRVEVDDDYSEIVWCNHDGYYEEEYEGEHNRSDGSVTVWTERHEVCDKCNAWRTRGEDEWHDSPIYGESEQRYVTV